MSNKKANRQEEQTNCRETARQTLLQDYIIIQSDNKNLCFFYL